MKVRVASAGTGKTTSLVARFLVLIGEGEPLRRLAGVTFTRAAAAELRQRVAAGVHEMLAEGSYLDGVVVAPEDSGERYREALREVHGATLSTIHGFMATGLRLSAPLLGLDPDFGTLPEWEAQAILGEELAGLLKLAREPGHPLHAAAERLGDRATELVDTLFQERSLTERPEPAPEDSDAAALTALYHAAYRRFAARTGSSRLAPSEIEARALALVRSPQALARLAARTPRVVVDEFQDVNPLQGRFFAALEQGGVQVEVVGDPKQSIYVFRHADVEVFRQELARAATRGELLEPLTESRRHAQLIVRFLNALTRTMAANAWGFGPDEAPDVRAAGSQAELRGRVEIHWISGTGRLDELRPSEAGVVAERLVAAHERGRPWSDMAVLARNYRGLERIRRALAAHSVPAVLRQGRGYYERSEVRDLVHALKVGTCPHDRVALATWARGPFGGLTPGEIDALLRADDPLEALSAAHPQVAARLERTARAVEGSPLSALQTLVRTPMIDGRRFVELLSKRQRDNVDALLFEIAEQPPAELETLLDRLDLLSRQAKEAGDMPAAGEGVTLLTVHGAKGLEWPLVAVTDLGAGTRRTSRPLILDEGQVHLPGGAGFAAAARAEAVRRHQESYRLLYVAVSRARDELILSGCVTDRGPQGWAAVLERMGLAPGARERSRDDFVLQVHEPRTNVVGDAPEHEPPAPGRAAAPWTGRTFETGALPPVESPSRLRGQASDRHMVYSGGDGSGDDGSRDDGSRDDGEPAEPLRPGTVAEAERLPGQAVSVGTLLHDAIRRDADPDDAAAMELLRAQEVMFPYDVAEQDRILGEVRDMLRVYRGLLGSGLPTLDQRQHDLREWPVLLPDGRQTWQGVIDRLYLAGDTWYLDDYKTDRTLRPARYAFQLAVYREAVRQVLGVEPVARLVGLRDGSIVPMGEEALSRAWRERPDAGGLHRGPS